LATGPLLPYRLYPLEYLIRARILRFIYSISLSTLELITRIVEEGDRRSINTTLIEKGHSKKTSLDPDYGVGEARKVYIIARLPDGGREGEGDWSQI
jgi:hypothetical protein